MSRLSRAGFREAWPIVLTLGVCSFTLLRQLGVATQRLQETATAAFRPAEEVGREADGAAHEVVLAAMTRIPPRGAYVLALEGDPGRVSSLLRSALAPRVPYLLRRDEYGWWKFDWTPQSIPLTAVLVPASGAPRVLDTRVLLESSWSSLGGRPDQRIPGWLDAPGENTTVTGDLLVSGWCQELGARPCQSVRIWVDGGELPPEAIERFSRPDVEAAVPGIGNCGRAGCRARLPGLAVRAGRHSIAAALITADGRYRRIGPRWFTWLHSPR